MSPSVGSTEIPSDDSALVAELQAAHVAVTRAQRALLEVVAKCERAEPWRKDGCRDLAQWLSSRLQISNWAARRWIKAAEALAHLPRTEAALQDGSLSLDKVLELSRFATQETEQKLLKWAQKVTVAWIRHQDDLASSPPEKRSPISTATGSSTTGG